MKSQELTVPGLPGRAGPLLALVPASQSGSGREACLYKALQLKFL